jgi:superfamily II DNA or RNA helicase
VKALADALSNVEGSRQAHRIYPNRIHGLLSDDPARSVNSSTLEAIEHGLDVIERMIPARPEDPEQSIRRALAAARATAGNEEDAILHAAQQVGAPLSVVRLVAEQELHMGPENGESRAIGSPDWSWQNEAVNASITSLRKRRDSKVGLVIPTGGGKTRIALQVILKWLSESSGTDGFVLWVTHRRSLRLQARRTLQQLLREPDHAPEAASLFAERIKFVMLADLSRVIREMDGKIDLVVIDEAHHAAAPSYGPIFHGPIAPVLFLTATPNRTDELPIGIHEIAYTITYRELFARGCVIEPKFAPPLDLSGLDWSTSAGVRDLSEYLLEQTESEFGKVLVAVSLQDRASILHEAVTELLDARPAHPLSCDDVGYVHAAGNSSGSSDATEFLDEFKARPKGILIATSQLIGEGYDDPSIDAVVVTYPSSSVGHLMQVAGRALRWAPGKVSATVVQVRESPLQYHFEQRWLYQDISDKLRPELFDVTYGSLDELRDVLEELLAKHNVAVSVRRRIFDQVKELETCGELRLMLTGVPFYGRSEKFHSDATWGAILVDTTERQRFTGVFNDVSIRSEDIKEHGLYLASQLPPDGRAGSLWKSYIDLILAAEYARKEITQSPYYGRENRPYRLGLNTTWLRYITLKFVPQLPTELDQFLRDAVNRDSITSAYVRDPRRWVGVVRLELPLVGSEAFLLDVRQSEWLHAQRQQLIDLLHKSEPASGFMAVDRWRSSLESLPLPVRIVDHIAQLIRSERFSTQYLSLKS